MTINRLTTAQRTENIRTYRSWRQHPIKTALASVAVLLMVHDHIFNRHENDDLRRYDGRQFTCVGLSDDYLVRLKAPGSSTEYITIGLLGVDTSELPIEGMAARQLTDQLQSLVDTTVSVRMSPAYTRDDSGQLMGFVYEPGSVISINAKLIRDGLAPANCNSDHVAHDDFMHLEQLARRGHRGRWKQGG